MPSHGRERDPNYTLEMVREQGRLRAARWYAKRKAKAEAARLAAAQENLTITGAAEPSSGQEPPESQPTA
jgi:hypothetical protein